MLFISLKNKKKIVFLKNVCLGLLIFICGYYPFVFYKSYSKLKGSYTFLLFIFIIFTTIIFHYLLIVMLYNLNKPKKEGKNEELIEEEIQKAMIDE